MVKTGDTVRVGSSTILYAVDELRSDGFAMLKAVRPDGLSPMKRERCIDATSPRLKVVSHRAPTAEEFEARVARNLKRGTWINGALHHWGCRCGCSSSAACASR